MCRTDFGDLDFVDGLWLQVGLPGNDIGEKTCSIYYHARKLEYSMYMSDNDQILTASHRKTHVQMFGNEIE
jgi:outer membrane lipopolysaccharide assembly protein LptE/RlpB